MKSKFNATSEKIGLPVRVRDRFLDPPTKFADPEPLVVEFWGFVEREEPPPGA